MNNSGHLLCMREEGIFIRNLGFIFGNYFWELFVGICGIVLWIFWDYFVEIVSLGFYSKIFIKLLNWF